MTEQGKAAFIIAQAACAQIEAISMQEYNRRDERAGRPATFQPVDFANLIDKYVIGHNAAIGFMRD